MRDPTSRATRVDDFNGGEARLAKTTDGRPRLSPAPRRPAPPTSTSAGPTSTATTATALRPPAQGGTHHETRPREHRRCRVGRWTSTAHHERFATRPRDEDRGRSRGTGSPRSAPAMWSPGGCDQQHVVAPRWTNEACDATSAYVHGARSRTPGRSARRDAMPHDVVDHIDWIVARVGDVVWARMSSSGVYPKRVASGSASFRTSERHRWWAPVTGRLASFEPTCVRPKFVIASLRNGRATR